jgi:hypothetical protein
VVVKFKDKNGSHVGMMLSFVIFITFIIFVYAAVKPAVKTGEDKRTTMDYIEKKIEENTSVELASISLKISESQNPSTECVNFSNFFPYSLVSPNLIIKNESGDVQEAYYNITSDFSGFRLYRADTNNIFFKVYHSPEFDKLPGNLLEPCTPIDYISDYNITSTTTREYLFERKMYNLLDYYRNNYEELKDRFNVPPGTEFGFVFMQSNGTTIEVGNASENTDVYVRETPVQYIDNEANILSGFINIKVW